MACMHGLVDAALRRDLLRPETPLQDVTAHSAPMSHPAARLRRKVRVFMDIWRRLHQPIPCASAAHLTSRKHMGPEERCCVTAVVVTVEPVNPRFGHSVAGSIRCFERLSVSRPESHVHVSLRSSPTLPLTAGIRTCALCTYRKLILTRWRAWETLFRPRNMTATSPCSSPVAGAKSLKNTFRMYLAKAQLATRPGSRSESQTGTENRTAGPVTGPAVACTPGGNF
jgi:hypothetical protein